LPGAFTHELQEAPQAYAKMMVAIDFMVGPAVEIVIAGPIEDKGTKNMLQKIYCHFVPNMMPYIFNCHVFVVVAFL
jgi:uncharacterized protein YyaL (SSP411 family)